MGLFLPLLALGLSAAGTAMNYAGQKKAARAEAQVYENYRRRNKEREAEAARIFNESLGRSGADDAEAAIDKGTARREQVYDRLNTQAAAQGQALPMTATGNRLVDRRPSPVKNAGTAWSRLLGRAQARYGGYGDWLLDQNINDARSGQELNRISFDARSDLNNVVPVQAAYARTKGDPLRLWGQLAGAAGQVIGMGAATGMWGQPAPGLSAGGMSPARGTELADLLDAGGGSMYVSMFNRPPSVAWASLR